MSALDKARAWLRGEIDTDPMQLVRELVAASQEGEKAPKLPAEVVNALPKDVRSYIMWLETNADPAGDLARNWHLTRENAALRKLMEQRAQEASEAVASRPMPKGWRDAQTYDDLYACGIRGFLDLDNRHNPEAEVVAAVKEAMAAIERGEFEEVAFIGDDLPPLPPATFGGGYAINPAAMPDKSLWDEDAMRKFARDTLNRYAKHFKAAPTHQAVEGMVVVPREALIALQADISDHSSLAYERIRAMLAAAPQATKEDTHAR